MRVNTKGYIETYFGPDIGRLLVPSLRSLLPLRTVPISAYAKINFFAVVKVEVQNHEITGVEVVEHKDAYMEQAEQIAGAVCSEQSLEVDAVSGATLTSDTILKAIENALEDAASNRK